MKDAPKGTTTMKNLKGMLIKQLVDVGVAQQPRWMASTLDNKHVLIKFEYGTLTVTIEDSPASFVTDLKSTESVPLTTEVMLLITGLGVV